MSARLPLVIILGATGCGKTKLSLQVAQKFGGEVIGADSMQIYKGLDIITAKATKEEQSMATHHLIDCVEPHEHYTVLEYRNRALKIVDRLFQTKKLPIVVGGTNYYIESLLWKILIDNPDETYSTAPGILPDNDHELPSEELHKKLISLDPEMARRLHPNNKRKILRSLEVYYKNKRKHSDLLLEQQTSPDGSPSGGGLRYPNSLVLWLQCEPDVLHNRLDARVDSMIEQGLLDELKAFHDEYNKSRLNENESPDYSRGIFQSIGLKEFHPYLTMTDAEKESDKGRQVFAECVDQLKLVTRRYSRRQIKWTVNRFLGREDRQVPPVYGLDATDPGKWDESVLNPAVNVISSFIAQTECEIEPLARRKVNTTPNALEDTHRCEVCDRIFIGLTQYTLHMKSNNHKRRLNGETKKMKDEMKQE